LFHFCKNGTKGTLLPGKKANKKIPGNQGPEWGTRGRASTAPYITSAALRSIMFRTFLSVSFPCRYTFILQNPKYHFGFAIDEQEIID
jgi:hypothetical protein